MVFRSTRVELAEDGGVAVDGELEIKGIARPVSATGTYRPPVEDPFGATRAASVTATATSRSRGPRPPLDRGPSGDARLGRPRHCFARGR
jgi:hypothetical protein